MCTRRYRMGSWKPWSEVKKLLMLLMPMLWRSQMSFEWRLPELLWFWRCCRTRLRGGIVQGENRFLAMTFNMSHFKSSICCHLQTIHISYRLMWGDNQSSGRLAIFRSGLLLEIHVCVENESKRDGRQYSASRKNYKSVNAPMWW